MRASWLHGVALLLAVAAARAAAAAEPMDRDLMAGKNLYDEARFAEAIPALQEAVRTLEPQRATEGARTQLVQAYLHLGLSYFALRDGVTAKDAFRNVVRLDPARRLDPELYAPRVVELFEQARMAVTAGEAPPAPAPPRAVFLFGLEATVDTMRYGPWGLGRFHESAFDDPSVPPARPAQPLLASGRLRAAVGLGATGELWGAYRQSAREGLRTLSDAFVRDVANHNSRSASVDSREGLALRSLDVGWSPPDRVFGVISVRRELGYRYLSVDQRSQGLLIDDRGAARVERTYDATSAIDAHGVRAGIGGRAALGARWDIELGLGFTFYVYGHERLTLAGRPLSEKTYSDAQWDVIGRLRLNLGRGVSLAVGYRWEPGASSGELRQGSNLTARGPVLVSLAYRRERSAQGSTR